MLLSAIRFFEYFHPQSFLSSSYLLLASTYFSITDFSITKLTEMLKDNPNPRGCSLNLTSTTVVKSNYIPQFSLPTLFCLFLRSVFPLIEPDCLNFIIVCSALCREAVLLLCHSLRNSTYIIVSNISKYTRH